MTEAQKRANAKYRKANQRQLSINFYSPREHELYNWCKAQGSSALKQILWKAKEQNDKIGG